MQSWTITTRYGKWSTKKLKHTICLENNIHYTIEVDRGHFFQFSWRHQSWFLVSKRYINHEVCDFINCLLLSWSTQAFPIMSDVGSPISQELNKSLHQRFPPPIIHSSWNFQLCLCKIYLTSVKKRKNLQSLVFPLLLSEIGNQSLKKGH